MNKTAHVQVFVLFFVGKYPLVLVRPNNKHIFQLIRYCQTIFQSGYAIANVFKAMP